MRWFTKNWASTDLPTHPDLAPFDLPVPPGEAVARVRAAVSTLARWRVESDGTVLHLTRRTRVCRFVDDIRVRFLPAGGGGTRVHAESRSRVGVGDLGQNRRNILELWEAVSAQLSAVSQPRNSRPGPGAGDLSG